VAVKQGNNNKNKELSMNSFKIPFVYLALLSPLGVNAAVYEFTPYDLTLVYSDKEKVSLAYSSYQYNFNGDYSDALGGGETGESFEDTNVYTFGVHKELSENMDVSAQLYDPYNLNVSHQNGFYAGTQALIETQTLAITFKYQLSEQYSVYGGPTINKTSGNMTINSNIASVSAGYSVGTVPSIEADFGSDTALGYVAGASFEIPDIALRASLTYQSAVDHSFDVTETSDLILSNTGGVTDESKSESEFSLPKAIMFDFQTGIAEGTLLTFTAQWREWSDQRIETSVAGELATYDKDAMTYKLGLAKQFNDQVAAYIQYIHEEPLEDEVNPLAPNDGYRGVFLAGSYLVGDTNLIAAYEYAVAEDVVDEMGTEFEDNVIQGITFMAEYYF